MSNIFHGFTQINMSSSDESNDYSVYSDENESLTENTEDFQPKKVKISRCCTSSSTAKTMAKKARQHHSFNQIYAALVLYCGVSLYLVSKVVSYRLPIRRSMAI